MVFLISNLLLIVYVVGGNGESYQQGFDKDDDAKKAFDAIIKRPGNLDSLLEHIPSEARRSELIAAMEIITGNKSCI